MGKPGKFQHQITAFVVTHRMRLEKGALNFFVFWQGIGFVNFLRKRLHKPSPVDPEILIWTVCEYFNITEDWIVSKSRSAHIAYPRQIAMFFLREDTDLPLKAIALRLGRKDHSTKTPQQKPERSALNWPCLNQSEAFSF